jgi:hypothetical protein
MQFVCHFSSSFFQPIESVQVERMQDYNGSLAALEIFICPPLGLCCCHEDCLKNPGIKIEHLSIQMHLRKHGLKCNASLMKDIALYYKGLLTKSVNLVIWIPL